MKRDYANGSKEDIVYFTGIEVEKTPALGMDTLFVTGVQPCHEIQERLGDRKHIFFGANHSFNPGTNFPEDADEWTPWENMITAFLTAGKLCSLDIPITLAEAFLESGLIEYDNFIPQLRIPLPYAKLWNYNTMLKIDDKDFKATNPGVWCHSLHDLMDRNKFTDWSQYGLDKPVE